MNQVTIPNPLIPNQSKHLTVGELIHALSEYPSEIKVAIQNNPYTGRAKHAITKMDREGFISGDFYMDKSTKVNLNYFLEEELYESEMDNYEKVLIIGASITKSEIEQSRLYEQKEKPYKAVRLTDYPSPEQVIGAVVKQLNQEAN